MRESITKIPDELLDRGIEIYAQLPPTYMVPTDITPDQPNYRKSFNDPGEAAYDAVFEAGLFKGDMETSSLIIALGKAISKRAKPIRPVDREK